MKKLIYPLWAIALLFSCGGGADETTEEETSDESVDTLTEEVQEIPIDITLNKILEVPSECVVTGDIVDIYTWNDKNGINYFIRTQGELMEEAPKDEYQDAMATQYLYAYHYIENGKGEISLLKETTDFIKDCEFDLIIGHELDALTLTDIDEDEVGEIAFIYRTACTSDLSPSTQKLIMLENGDKYPLRGYTEVMGEGGEYEAGKEFDSAPAGFLEHAEKLWSEHLVEYDFDL